MWHNNSVVSGVLVKENTAFLELPYEGDQEAISMFIYLPLDEKPNAIDNFLSIFSHATIQQAMFSKNYKLIDILMPKIAFKSELHLKDVSDLMKNDFCLFERTSFSFASFKLGHKLCI